MGFLVELVFEVLGAAFEGAVGLGRTRLQRAIFALVGFLFAAGLVVALLWWRNR